MSDPRMTNGKNGMPELLAIEVTERYAVTDTARWERALREREQDERETVELAREHVRWARDVRPDLVADANRNLSRAIGRLRATLAALEILSPRSN